MRIRLEKNKQMKLIGLAKGTDSWPIFSKKLNISEGYLRIDLYKEKRLISEKTYKKLKKIIGKDYDKFIIEKLEDNWGKVLGGKNSWFGLSKKVSFPKKSENLAELWGIILGDGNINKTKSYKKGTYTLTITGDTKLDKEYFEDYVKPLIENSFHIKTRYYKPKTSNAIALICTGRLVIDFFEREGLKPGDKIRNQSTIPQWIFDNKDYLSSCIRGLYDTDGCVYKLNKQNTYQISFTNRNKKLLKDLRIGLIKIGIIPSEISCGEKIYITKKSELRKFLKLVNFRNPRHLNKINCWKI